VADPQQEVGEICGLRLSLCRAKVCADGETSFGRLALPALRRSCVLVCTGGVFSTAVVPGAIAFQAPPPGFHVKSGSAVTVRVSLGGKTIDVPDIRESSLNTAQREIERAGLVPGLRARVEGEGAADRVIATGPPVGQQVAPITRIDLLVNTAPHRQLWVMPSLVSQSLDRVEQFCRLNRLRLGRAREVNYPGIPSGLVLRQYPPAGSPVAPSEIITVWVSR